MTAMETVRRYRAAARKLFKLTEAQAIRSIYTPNDDRGQWAPKSKAIINFEHGDLPQCGYYAPKGLDNCIAWACEAGVGYVEYYNAAIAAVWE